MAYRILSFCGGGVRGLLSIGLLNRLQQSSGKVVHDTDLLAGTSTGADIVSMIVAGWPTDVIYKAYQNQKAFDNPKTANTAPAYDIQNLIDAQTVVQPANRQLKDIPRSVLFTSFNVGSPGVPWQPLLLHNLPNSSTADTHIVDAVVSSSAMPGMYGSHNGNVDGAFVHHDPTLAAIAAAVNSGQQLEDIVVLCFGTGFMANWIGADTSNWGAQQWQTANPANSQLPSLLINGTVSPILNMCLNGTSTNLVPQLCQMLLGSRYVYLNPVLDKVIPENDTNPADIQYMEQLVSTFDLAAASALVAKYWT